MAEREVCPRCGAEVRLVLTVGQLVRKLDPRPRPDGNHIIVTLDDGRVRAQVLTGDEMPAQQEAFKAHECGIKERPGPLCATCHLPPAHAPRDRPQAAVDDAPGCGLRPDIPARNGRSQSEGEPVNIAEAPALVTIDWLSAAGEYHRVTTTPERAAVMRIETARRLRDLQGTLFELEAS